VSDVLWPTGRLRECLLRAEITKNCKARLIFLTSPWLREALDCYLDYWVANDMGCAIDRGRGCELVRKIRKIPDGRQA
jgi:hypothetical protein